MCAMASIWIQVRGSNGKMQICAQCSNQQNQQGCSEGDGARTGGIRNAYKISCRTPERKKQLQASTRENNTTRYDTNRIRPDSQIPMTCNCEYGTEPSDSIVKGRTLLDEESDYHHLKEGSLHGVTALASVSHEQHFAYQ
jgi:hypothetical protein